MKGQLRLFDPAVYATLRRVREAAVEQRHDKLAASVAALEIKVALREQQSAHADRRGLGQGSQG